MTVRPRCLDSLSWGGHDGQVQHPRAFPTTSDQLGEALHMLQVTGALYCRAELTAPWGIDVPRLDGLMMFHIVTAGRCWLEVEGHAPRLLQPGSLALVPHSTPHLLRSDLDAAAEPLFDIPVELVSDRYEIIRLGGGGEPAQVTCVVAEPDQESARRLVAQLPDVLVVDAWDDGDASWLHSTLRLMTREAAALRPGGEMVLTRLADVLVVQAVRAWLESAPEARVGWLAALRDEHVGRALIAIHRSPEKDWGVDSLARRVGMSRSAFSARFTDLVGESVMRYVTDWRMQLARTHLQSSSEPLSAVAHRFGYQSEAAFSRAFVRRFGIRPGAVRRSDQDLQRIRTGPVLDRDLVPGTATP
jgi:AraC-like DNA-binding protein